MVVGPLVHFAGPSEPCYNHAHSELMVKYLIIALTAIVSALLGMAAVAQAGDAGLPQYPDLKTLTPSNLHLQRDRATGQKLLRFSNTVADLGDGALEVFPVNNAATGKTEAYQRIFTHDSDGVWSVYNETPAGLFEFHPPHNHWHWNNFALYELRSVASDGSIGSQVYASSGKVTFCIADTTAVDLSLEHATGDTYTSCSQNSTQGLSVGWGDTYPWNIAGQSLNITTVPNGTYWLVSIADPDNLLAETDNTNNAAALKISLKGNTVKLAR